MGIYEWSWMARYFWRRLSPVRKLSSVRKALRDWRRFWRTYERYGALAYGDAHAISRSRKEFLQCLYPCTGDATPTTAIEPVYFFQDAWAFDHIVRSRPSWHVDVGSHHKYVALLSKILPVTMVDIRPLSLSLSSITFRQGSVLELPYDDDSVPSLSSLCVVEHVGLGRYGDPLDTKGSEKALAELKRVMAHGGNLYISVPVGAQNQVFFNAHRVFSLEHIESMIKPLTIKEVRYIYDNEFVDQPRQRIGVACLWLYKD